MFRFLENFDRISFWLGFFAATLFWWLIRMLKPLAERFLQSLREQSRFSKLGASAVTEIRFRNDLMRHVQGLHIAAPLFSLDEIVISPRLLAPPIPTEPGVLPSYLDITEQVIPYMLDAPELATYYGAPTITLIEALQGTANLLILGNPGAGKSIALAHLAAQLARQEHIPTYLERRIPLFIHAADLLLPPVNPENLLEPIADAIARVCPSIPETRLDQFLIEAFSQGRALLLLDDLDELPPEVLKVYVSFFEKLLQQYPAVRFVATATPEYIDGITGLDCVPLTLASWDEDQRREFINRWSDLWTTHIGPRSDDTGASDSVLLNAWLMNDAAILSPIEITLKVWGVYAGDLAGARIQDWIEAYLQRMCVHITKGRAALEILARQALLSPKTVFSQKEAHTWLREIEPPSAVETLDEGSPPSSETTWPPPLVSQESSHITDKPIRDSRVLPELVDSGLLKTFNGDNLTFSHPLLLSYLAACDLAAKGWANWTFISNQWCITNYSIGFLSSRRDDVSSLLAPYIENDQEPVYRELLIAAKWLRYAPENAAWRSGLMRQLAKILQNESHPMGLRGRVLTSMALSGTAGVDTLFRQYLTSPEAGLRLHAALGCGLMRDGKAVNDLKTLLTDIQPNVRRAACLSLVAIGNQYALEAVADTLLHGDEDQRRAAAEALANNLEEGEPTLKEGATLSDVMVRRAVVYGLRRVHKPWSTETLQHIQVTDTQWVVKDAATQVLDEMEQPNPHLPRSIPDLTETPWLIAFAGERGIGISPGKPALDLLLLALKEGKEEQRLAALEYLTRNNQEIAIPAISQIYTSTQGELREAAFNTLWHYARAGVRLSEMR